MEAPNHLRGLLLLPDALHITSKHVAEGELAWLVHCLWRHDLPLKIRILTHMCSTTRHRWMITAMHLRRVSSRRQSRPWPPLVHVPHVGRRRGWPRVALQDDNNPGIAACPLGDVETSWIHAW